MTYSKRTPPIKLLVDVKKFNLLLETISKYTAIDDEKMRIKASKLKEKILRYSVPYESEEREKMVDIRFFINEVEDLMNIFLFEINDIDINENYYEELLNNRELISKQYEEKINRKGE